MPTCILEATMASTALSCRVRAAACHGASCHTIKLPCHKFGVQTSLRPPNLLRRHPAALSGGERRVASRKLSCRANAENNSEPDDAGLDSFRSRMENVWMKEEEKDIQMKLDAAVDGKFYLKGHYNTYICFDFFPYGTVVTRKVAKEFLFVRVAASWEHHVSCGQRLSSLRGKSPSLVRALRTNIIRPLPFTCTARGVNTPYN
jgi:hypothetical protein